MSFDAPAFLFALLPLLLVVYALLPGNRSRNWLLIAASLLFCACGDSRSLVYLLGMVALHYGAGRLLLRLERGRKWLSGAVIVLDVGALLALKVTGTAILGVSYFTFQAISYVADACRDRQNATKNFRHFLQYLTFFPQLTAGPLLKFREARPYLDPRPLSWPEMTNGLVRFTIGLGKKLFLAGAAAKFAGGVYGLAAADLDIRTAWVGAVAYCLQLYFDFSGYTDMALGLGQMVGYPLPENFDHPFCSKSVGEFWRRWHITLGRWFRDYIYIPLGGSRRGTARAAVNKLVVFAATGLWHGVGWTFLIWGLWNGLLVVLETVTPMKKIEKSGFGRVYAVLAAVLGFAVFRAADLSQAGAMLSAMFTGFSLTAASTRMLAETLTLRTGLLCLLALALCQPWRPKVPEWVKLAGALLLLVLCVLALAAGSFQPFIYASF